MMRSMLVFLLGFAGAAQAAPGSDGLVMAQRLVRAIKGEADFQTADFARPLGEADKAALRRFATCKVGNIAYALIQDPNDPDVYSEDPDFVGISLGCKGVSWKTPVAISVHLRDGRIVRVETHNADLVRPD